MDSERYFSMIKTMQTNTNTTATTQRSDRQPNLAGRSNSAWKSVLELNDRRVTTGGSGAALCGAIQRGADLRILTEFIYNEHIDTRSENSELVREVSDFRVTYLIEDRWAAGIMSLRMPIEPPEGFGPRASMSFFLYNQDGQQAIARPYLDGPPVAGPSGPSPLGDFGDMPKYHQQDSWDAATNAPSSNFVYDFNVYRYLVRDNWEEVFAHTAQGEPVFGSLESLYEAFSQGCEIKVGIRGLCDDLADDSPRPTNLRSEPGWGQGAKAVASVPDHTVFVHTGPGYYCTQRKLFCAGSQPVVRVRPGMPMRYTSGGWDFGWLMPRSDGFVDRWICDPYTLRFTKKPGRYALRWFVR
jgi:hypothetical protein